MLEALDRPCLSSRAVDGTASQKPQQMALWRKGRPCKAAHKSAPVPCPYEVAPALCVTIWSAYQWQLIQCTVGQNNVETGIKDSLEATEAQQKDTNSAVVMQSVHIS